MSRSGDRSIEYNDDTDTDGHDEEVNNRDDFYAQLIEEKIPKNNGRQSKSC
jgi:hypothetical protein